ncbi:MAG: Vms1/Ankzf1 family peptidyl-tRNA hydrolase [Candidatus Nanohaloarchaea archaeon]
MWPLKSEDREERIQELEEKLEEVKEEKEKWRKRFEAEEERRSELSRKKQEAEEELNRLKDRVEGLESNQEEQVETEEGFKRTDLDFESGKKAISMLDSISSPEEDLVTVYFSEKEDLNDIRGLKNSISAEQFNKLSRTGVYFFDRDGILDLYLDTRPFFKPEWDAGEEFSLDKIKGFVEKEKIWVKVSAGDSKIFRESSGEIELVEHVKDRVNSQHRSGGFSQSRFERKREEQIEGHLENLEKFIPEDEEVFLVGEKDLCKELNGTYLGGFNPNMGSLKSLYRFGFRRL